MTTNAAVVIGINYTNIPGIRPLAYAEADAADMAIELARSGYAVTQLLGSEATQRAIVTKVIEAAVSVESGGVLLIHFAGHGALDERGQAYLIPYDVDDRPLAANAVRMDDIIGRHLDAAPVAVVLLDCCHSGFALGVRGPVEEEAAQRSFADHVNRVIQAVGGTRHIITACSGNEKAHERRELKHGVFTFYTLQHWTTYEDSLTSDVLYNKLFDSLEKAHVPTPVQGGTRKRITLRGLLKQAASEATGSGEIESNVAVFSMAGQVVDDNADEDETVTAILANLLPQFEALDGDTQLDRVITLGEQILWVDPSHEPTRTRVIDAHAERGRRLMKRKENLRLAVYEFTRAIQLAPWEARLYYLRALCHRQISEYDLALADLTQALSIEPDVATYHYHRGVVYMNLEKWEEAITALRHAIRRDPVRGDYHFALGRVYENAGNIPKARRSYELAAGLGVDLAVASIKALPLDV